MQLVWEILASATTVIALGVPFVQRYFIVPTIDKRMMAMERRLNKKLNALDGKLQRHINDVRGKE